MLRFAAVLLVALNAFCCTAALAQPPSDLTACRERAAGAALEPIRFATDRPADRDPSGRVSYSTDRPEFHGVVGFGTGAHPYKTTHDISYGTLTESGRVAPDPSDRANENNVFPNIIAALESDKNAALVVYVHGYNTDFQGAADGALTLRLGLSCATDFKRKIVVLFFAWPSSAHLLKPSDDEVRAEWAYRDFQRVMTNLSDALSTKSSLSPERRRPFAVAHSMGNRFLVNHIDRCESPSELPGAPPKKCFAGVAFVAPDVDARLFADALGSHPDAADGMTLYLSPRDKVLWASHYFHGEGRAGSGGEELLRFSNRKIVTVDASYVQAETLCHSYIDRPVVLFDIAKSFFPDDVANAPTRFAAQRSDEATATYYELVENENSHVKAACVGAPLRGRRY
jgi:esterase/lipase superfamily enzyme